MVATRRLAAIVFTDIVGYTALAQADEAGALKLLREEEELVRPLLVAHEGREIKSTGDGFLVEFDSALRAVQCAIDIHHRLQERNSQAGATPISLRIGIHLGDVEEHAGDIFGDAVNIASRIEPLALPGGVCISAQVFDQVRNKIPNRFEKLESKVLKNIRLPMDVYRILLPWDSPEAPSAAAPRTRLAVLPLANISPDPKDEYFADGLTEELIGALSKIRELRVIARTSVGQYKSGTKSVSQIGVELGVGTVLEGSVRKAGDRLRITLQLIDAGTQEHIWANSYDRELDDVFAIQTEIAERTAVALRLELLGSERESIHRKPTKNIAAYNLYLRGIYAAHKVTLDGYAESIKLLDEAIRTDPGFSLAFSSLANMYILLSGMSLAPREAFPRAQALIAKALALDPNSSDAHTARGNLALQHNQDWETSEAEFRRALTLNPSDANAHFWYAMLLSVVQRFEEAKEELRTVIELDPLWELPKAWLTSAHELSGDFDEAIASAQEERDRAPGTPGPHILLGQIYARAGRLDEARKESELASGPVADNSELERALLRAALGEPDEGRLLAARLEEAAKTVYVSSSRIACLYAALGQEEKALEWLERDYRSGDRTFWYAYQSIGFDPLRDDPRFKVMVEKLKLPAEGDGQRSGVGPKR